MSKILVFISVFTLLFSRVSWAQDNRCLDLFSSERGEKEKSLSEIFDIRNYGKPVDSMSFNALEIKVNALNASLSIAIGRVNQGVVVNYVVGSGYGADITIWVAKLLTYQFADLMMTKEIKPLSGGGFSFLLKPEARDEIRKRFYKIKEYIEARNLPPYDAIPKNLKNKKNSERVDFLKDLLRNWLTSQGITPNEKFFKQNLSLMHKLFLQNLSPIELSVFHYSIFDLMMTNESQAQIYSRLEQINKLQTMLGLETYEAEALINGMRSKFLEIAQDLSKKFEQQQEQVSAARKKLDAYRQNMFEENYLKLKTDIEAQEELLAEIRKDMKIFINPASRDWWISHQSYYMYTSNDPKIVQAHQETESQLEKLNEKMRILVQKREEQIRKFTDEEKAAYRILVNDDSLTMQGSNFNPYGLDIDHDLMDVGTTVTLSFVPHYNDLRGSTPTGVLPSSASKSINMDRSVIDYENYGSNADFDTPLRDTEMSPRLVETLASYGITKVYEITNYSAKDYLEKFGMNLNQFHALLDELNVMGIHLHFDGGWDAQGPRIRKSRPEFYQYRHTPKASNIRWFDPYKQDRRNSED